MQETVQEKQADHFIYIVGEQQEGILAEQPEVFTFTKDSMQQIDTAELALVIANVFSKGQYFPGTDGALNAVIHEFVARAARYRRARSKLSKGRCTLVTAFKRLDGEISVKVTAVLPVAAQTLTAQDLGGFRALLIAALPDFQDALIQEAYAPDSKVINLIKRATLHHIQGSLQ